jgi:hypothetical protein
MVDPGKGTVSAPSRWYVETIYPAWQRLFVYSQMLNLRGDVQWCNLPGAITSTIGAAALAIKERRLARSCHRCSTLGSPPTLIVFFGSVFCQFFSWHGSAMAHVCLSLTAALATQLLLCLCNIAAVACVPRPDIMAALATQVLCLSRLCHRFLVVFP